MAEEMIVEDVPWEADEAEDSEAWEADEALIEAEDSAEDIGERWPSRRRRRSRKSHYRPARGVRGLVVRGQDGKPRKLPFPAKLATTDETNRGLATQEVARRALEERLDKLETRFQLQQKKDSSVSGVVSLAVGVPLSVWGAYKATQAGSSAFGNWAEQDATKTAAVVSATQLATSGAKLLVNGKYHRSGVGMAADIFAAVQLAGFTFASFYNPERPISGGTKKEAEARLSTFKNGQLVLTQEPTPTGGVPPDVQMWRVVTDASNANHLVAYKQ